MSGSIPLVAAKLNSKDATISKYVIIKKSFSKNLYSGKGHLDFYTLWFHTVTKYENNEPYFSANLDMRYCMAYAIHKKDIAKIVEISDSFDRKQPYDKNEKN